MADTAAATKECGPADAGLGFDVVALENFLRARIPGLDGTIAVDRAAGGMSNPTFFVSGGSRRLVLRKKPPMQLSAAAHRIDREYRLLQALSGSAVPVPAPVLYCEDESIVGTPFYVMERLEGVVSHDYALPQLAPEVKRKAFAGMAGTLGAIHRFDWQGTGLSGFGKQGDYFGRQLAGWSKQWSQFGIADNPDVDRLQAWLAAEMPADDGCATIAHGDYRVANVMFRQDGAVSGVFDWELATIGHPLADLGFCLQGWFLAPDENGGVSGLDLRALGIPSAHEFIDAYYAAAPAMPRLTAFHVAFAMYRAAVGVSGVAMRAASGAVPDPLVAAEARRFAKAYARAGIEAIESWD
ncbi:phosphotransferase family protein [Tsuneonella sp. CC-YZS046]|uniref:phosphotransferase family protein n=1 Tax=Tsuneonella sp. CC-YZS046 TaxID=3042152 RepID=UPI002D78E95E|nr:phosphotransferase family protein [Tsuneonella sp. CC-YZS046]WRO65324.1 phosphotransferase family protein [Tsuneonella sp. CC-YZS046]